jgi:hypothetical protein
MLAAAQTRVKAALGDGGACSRLLYNIMPLVRQRPACGRAYMVPSRRGVSHFFSASHRAVFSTPVAALMLRFRDRERGDPLIAAAIHVRPVEVIVTSILLRGRCINLSRKEESCGRED